MPKTITSATVNTGLISEVPVDADLAEECRLLAGDIARACMPGGAPFLDGTRLEIVRDARGSYTAAVQDARTGAPLVITCGVSDPDASKEAWRGFAANAEMAGVPVLVDPSKPPEVPWSADMLTAHLAMTAMPDWTGRLCAVLAATFLSPEDAGITVMDYSLEEATKRKPRGRKVKGRPLSRATVEWEDLAEAWPFVGTLPQSCTTLANIKEVGGWAAATLPPGKLDSAQIVLDPLLMNPEDVVWCARWRTCKQVYAVDAEVAAQLADQDFDGEMPVEALSRMPYPVVYVECPCEIAVGRTLVACDGFLAWTDVDVLTREKPQLMLCFLRDDGGKRALVPVDLELSTFDDVVSDLVAANEEMAAKESSCDVRVVAADAELARKSLGHALNILLYVITAEDDVEVLHRPPSGGRGQKAGKRTNPETVRAVGVKMGRAIGEARKAASAPAHGAAQTGRTVAPHVRRAHWQRFWTGKRKGRDDGKFGDKLVVKWIPPVYVNGAGEEVTVETVHASK